MSDPIYDQIERFRRDLFGPYCLGMRISAEESARRRYVPPKGVKFFRCHEDVNGEWVPSSEELSEDDL